MSPNPLNLAPRKIKQIQTHAALRAKVNTSQPANAAPLAAEARARSPRPKAAPFTGGVEALRGLVARMLALPVEKLRKISAAQLCDATPPDVLSALERGAGAQQTILSPVMAKLVVAAANAYGPMSFQTRGVFLVTLWRACPSFGLDGLPHPDTKRLDAMLWRRPYGLIAKGYVVSESGRFAVTERARALALIDRLARISG